MIEPIVSVCISTYNRVELLKLAIESVFSQTYACWELLICDDGSTDGTFDYVSTLKDSRIRYIHHPQNIGKSNNMRSGFEVARGEYFVKFDDDDRLTPEFLAQTVTVLKNFPDIDFVGTDHWVIDINNDRNVVESQQCSERWGRTELQAGVVNNLLEVVFVKGSFYIGATLFRRNVLKEIGYMRPNLQNCEDTDLFLRLALAAKKGYYSSQRLMEYRFHAEQQGIERAIPFRRDQLVFLEHYQFESSELEALRQSRISEIKLNLGLLLIQVNEIKEGRKLILAGKSASYLKAGVGLFLGLLDSKLRHKVYSLLTTLKKKN